KGKNKNIKTLSANETENVSWRAKANSTGEFVLTAEVKGELLGEEITASDTSLISAFGSLARRLFDFLATFYLT
ncbi:MAG: hypothetical protein HY431_02045, partial [Candidatus Levybacteria bacterium]|nr:hypothetical protein [Candidatus Levybacteria bacterium]